MVRTRIACFSICLSLDDILIYSFLVSSCSCIAFYDRLLPSRKECSFFSGRSNHIYRDIASTSSPSSPLHISSHTKRPLLKRTFATTNLIPPTLPPPIIPPHAIPPPSQHSHLQFPSRPHPTAPFARL